MQITEHRVKKNHDRRQAKGIWIPLLDRKILGIIDVLPLFRSTLTPGIHPSSLPSCWFPYTSKSLEFAYS